MGSAEEIAVIFQATIEPGKAADRGCRTCRQRIILKEKLLAPDLVAEFTRAYREEVSRLAAIGDGENARGGYCVNLGCVEGVDALALEIKIIDG